MNLARKKMHPGIFIFLLTILFYHLIPAQEFSTSYSTYRDHLSSSLIRTQWKSVGPTVNSARAEAVQGIPGRPGWLYVAFGSGNLWRTKNDGISWEAIFEDQPVQGIGDLAIAPSNPDILYVGCGESLRKQRNFTMPGNGIYRSDDGGDHWQHMGLDASWHIGEISVHPNNPDIVLVAVMGKFWSPSTFKGIFRTEDGGKSWEKVLYVNENSRANDVVFAPGNPNIAYATIWENHPDTSLRESVCGPNSGVYKSTDGGKSWKRTSQGLPNGERTGRMGLAVSYTDEDKAYVLVDNLNKSDRTKAAEIYRTVDGGNNWSRTHEEELLFSASLGWYFSDMYVNPQNDEEIFALGITLVNSQDGGKTFSTIGGEIQHVVPSAAQTLHLDQCELWINPENPNHLLIGNDGGLYESRDKGGHWRHHNNIASGEFYTITVEQQAPYRIFGGTQDNSTVYGTPEQGGYDWKYLWIDAWSGGDGCVSQVDWQDPNTIYFSAQTGAVSRLDFAADKAKGIRPRLPADYDRKSLSFSFVSPYFLSRFNPQHIYLGGNYIFKSTNRGDAWKVISPNLSPNQKTHHEISSAGGMAESPLKQGTLFVGMDDGRFWVTENDGTSWEERSTGLANRYIRSICPSAFDYNRVYTCMTGLNDDDLRPYVYMSEDRGKSWNALHNNLPNAPVNVILEDFQYPNLLYLGTHHGVFFSLDRGQHWMSLGTKLPMVSVADLEIIRDKKQLVAATHGRGIYTLDLSPLYLAMEKDPFSVVMDADLKITSIPEISAPKRRSTHRDIDLKSVQPLNVHFISPSSGTATLEISQDSTIYHTEIEIYEGLNHWQWDLVHNVRQSDYPYFIHFKEYLRPGTYTCTIKSADHSAEQEFVIRARD